MISNLQLNKSEVKEVFVKYSLENFDQENRKNELFSFQTKRVLLNSSEIDFEYKQVHFLREVSKESIDYFLNKNVCFEIYASFDRRIPRASIQPIQKTQSLANNVQNSVKNKETTKKMHASEAFSQGFIESNVLNVQGERKQTEKGSSLQVFNDDQFLKDQKTNDDKNQKKKKKKGFWSIFS